MTILEIVTQFNERMVPIGDAPALIGYSLLYGRRKILEEGVEDIDFIYVHGRIFVDREFLATITNE